MLAGMKLEIPHNAQVLVGVLETCGYEAYVVGGCVRDALLGRTPADWDICTSALPEQVKAAAQAAGFAVFDTGIAHGTVTVHVNHEPFEVTTYRSDGAYSDGRRPDGVAFLSSIEGDLLRRDFTVNAMAYHPQRGLVDVTDGQADLRAGVLRAVGDAHTRFAEDGLRIIRALRFAATYGFELEEHTRAAVHADRHLLSRVAMERIAHEFLSLICGDNAVDVLLTYRDVIAVFLPQVEPMFGFEQHNPYHVYDVWEHCVRSCGEIAPEPTLRLAALIHDIGKPSCFFTDEQGVGHFYGHPKAGEPLAREVCRHLRLPRAQADDVAILVRYHDRCLPQTVPAMRRLLLKLGERRCRMLFEVICCDLLTHGDRQKRQNLEQLADARTLFEETLARTTAFSVRDLVVNGRDLMALGFQPGPALGQALETLFEAVTCGELPNEHDALMERARALKEQGVQDGCS